MNNVFRYSALIVLLVSAPLCSQAEQSLSPYVNKKGEISMPSDFAFSLTHLGTWFVEDGSANGFHSVYTNAESIKAYQKADRFPDGTVIVKELRDFHSGSYTTGQHVNYAGQQVKQWFVMIKDSKNRFAGTSPYWGEGWGWALFKPDKPQTNLVKDFKADCITCHQPAKKTDWIYTEAYPLLQ